MATDLIAALVTVQSPKLVHNPTSLTSHQQRVDDLVNLIYLDNWEQTKTHASNLIFLQLLA